MMKQIITLFVVVSVCYGGPTDHGDIIVNNVTEPIPSVTAFPPGPPGHDNVTTTIKPTPPNTTTKPTTTTPSSNGTTTTTTTTTSKPTTTNATTTTPAPPTTTKPTNSTTAPSTTTVHPTNATTVLPTTKVTPTKSPTPSPTPASNRKFDGPSFVGGIVLASGLMAIGFVAFKFYKARTELNYHTL